MKKRTTQTGSAHLIIIIALVIALVGALGWIFWQNFITKEPVASNSDTTKTQADTDKEVIKLKNIDFTTESNSSGLTLSTVTSIDQVEMIPSDLKAFLKQTLQEYSSSLKSTDSCGSQIATISLSHTYKEGYADGTMSAKTEKCSGAVGAFYLWGKVDGSWQKISGTQNDGYACADLEKNQVPSTVAGTRCIKSDGSGYREYKQS